MRRMTNEVKHSMNEAVKNMNEEVSQTKEEILEPLHSVKKITNKLPGKK